MRGQSIERDAPAHIPHQDARVEVLRLDTDGPALAPGAERVDGGAEFSARFRQLVLAALPFVAGRAADDARHLQLAQTAREQRARDARNMSMDLVEAVTARQELAQDEWRPASVSYTHL